MQAWEDTFSYVLETCISYRLDGYKNNVFYSWFLELVKLIFFNLEIKY